MPKKPPFWPPTWPWPKRPTKLLGLLKVFVFLCLTEIFLFGIGDSFSKFKRYILFRFFVPFRDHSICLLGFLSKSKSGSFFASTLSGYVSVCFYDSNIHVSCESSVSICLCDV